jgi:hypothetical protein
LFLCVGLEPLPWKAPAGKVDDDVSQGFHVIPPGLFNANVSVDTGVTRGTYGRGRKEGRKQERTVKEGGRDGRKTVKK